MGQIINRYATRRITKQAGANRVKKDAVDFVSKIMEQAGRKLVGKALIMMEQAKRRTLMKKDILLVLGNGVSESEIV